jgi:hypothetical protein
MKKPVLVAGLCLAAFAMWPVTSASAERPFARCSSEGSASFSGGNLTPVPTPGLSYEFHGPVECEIAPTRETRKGIVVVNGKETLSCAGALGEAEGEGTLTFGGITLPFRLTFFSGGPGSTMLVAKFADGGVAVGGATFFKSVIQPAPQCFMPEGVSELEFKVVASGEL